MSATPVDEPPSIWRRLAQALDAYFVDWTKRPVPKIILRRSKHEAARCRMLMHKAAAVPVEASRSGRRIAQTPSRS
jgi:hypothetical protein